MSSSIQQETKISAATTATTSTTSTSENKRDFETSGATRPVWVDNEKQLHTFPKLSHNIETDVCVVGAGIAGLSTAYELCQQGKRVVIIEDGEVASGESGRTTAHLCNALDDRFYNLKHMHGLKGAMLANESHMWAVSRIEDICKRENIECEFQRIDGYLINGLPVNHPNFDLQEIQMEYDAAKECGVRVTFYKEGRVPGLVGFDHGGYLKFPQQGLFQPLKYLNALSRVLVDKYNCAIFTHTHAKEVYDDGRVVCNGDYTVTCKDIVLATNVPVNNMISIIDKLQMFRTYAIAGTVPKGSVPYSLIWDCAEPYHYVRFASSNDPTKDFIIVGGEDHKVGQAFDYDQRFAQLEEWTRARWPMTEEIVYRWSGQVAEPVDLLAYIGLNPGQKHVYICTGDSGNGMTHGTLAGKVIADLICGQQNSWAELYKPSRMSLRASWDFVRHNLQVQSWYARYAKHGDVTDIEEIGRGCGAVMAHGLTYEAVYKDNEGMVHKMSAVCPHMHGLVVWNDKEKSWDCPVHGSRFDCKGKVMNGPSMVDLPMYSVTAPPSANVSKNDASASDRTKAETSQDL